MAKAAGRASHPSGNVPSPMSVRSGGRAIPPGRPHALTRLGDSAAGQQVDPRFAIRAQVQTANHIGNWLIAEKGHGHHHPDNHVPGKRRRRTVACAESVRQCCIHSTGRCSANSCAEGGGISGWSLKSSRSLRSGIRKRLPVVEAVIVPQFKDRSTDPNCSALSIVRAFSLMVRTTSSHRPPRSTAIPHRHHGYTPPRDARLTNC